MLCSFQVLISSAHFKCSCSPHAVLMALLIWATLEHFAQMRLWDFETLRLWDFEHSNFVSYFANVREPLQKCALIMLVLPWAFALIVYALFCISFIYCKRYATKILKVKPPAPFSIPLANKNNIKLGGSSRVDLPHRYLSTGNVQPPSEPYVQVSPHTALPSLD